MKVINLISIFIITLLMFSCNKKKDDPQPTVQNRAEEPVTPPQETNLEFMTNGVWFPLSVNDTLLDIQDSVYSLTAKNGFYFNDESGHRVLPFQLNDLLGNPYKNKVFNFYFLLAYDKVLKTISLKGLYKNGSDIEGPNEYDMDGSDVGGGISNSIDVSLKNPISMMSTNFTFTVRKIDNNTIEINQFRNSVTRRVLYKRNALRFSF